MKLRILIPERNILLTEWEKSLIDSKEGFERKWNVLPQISNIPAKIKKIFQEYKLSKNQENFAFIADSSLGYLLNFFYKKRSVVWCWDLCYLFLGSTSLKSKMAFKINVRGMSKAKRIIVASENTKRDFLKYTGIPENKIKVIYAGVSHKNFKRYSPKSYENARAFVREKCNVNDNEKLLLYVGGEQPRKNIPTLLKAVKMIKTPIKLLIIGPRDYGERNHEELVNLVKHLDIENKIIFAGNFPHDSLPDYFNAADLFVFPSYYEGFGLPPLEAMSCGLPVITTGCSSLPEVVGDAAIKITDPFDDKILAEKIDLVLTDKNLRENMIKKGLEQSKKFSWKKYAKDVSETCMEIWNEKKRC
ncbi:MAG: glycosyltransferase family 4 protein [Candidatus Aenigmarchaeota archaeon]|nr:glycosyltransferase family 4 protein [Candidatus Aenigmarchaeota archaeon]